jgi:anti-sigma-K factor RskA
MTGHEAFDAAPAAYALDALDAADRAAFEAHLRSCSECQRDVAEFRRVAAALGAAVEPVAPPESLKARTLARVAAQPAEPRGDVPPPRARLEFRAPSAPQGRTGWQWLVNAAAVVLVAGLGIYAWSLRSEVALLRQTVVDAAARAEALRTELNTLRRDSLRLSNTVNVLSAPDLLRVDLKGLAGAPGAAGRAYLSRSQGLVFAATGLPALRPGRVYQLWVIPPGGAPISAGILPSDGAGSPFSAPLPAPLQAIQTVAVTDEPGPAGSAGPTSTPLLAGSTGG